MSDMTNMIRRIKNITEKHGVNGIQLGKILGLKKSPLTDWKNKKAKPTLEQIIKICEYCAVSSDYLLFGKEAAGQTCLSDDEEELLNNYKSLDSRGKHKLHSIIYEELDRISEQQIKKQEEPAVRFTFHK